MKILQFLFYFYLAMIVYNKLTIKYVNPYKTVLYYGKKGCGKTTLLTKLSMKALKNNQVVYSSVEIPGTRLFNPKDLNRFKPDPYSIVMIDEIGLIWDNRNFKSFESGVNEFFKYARQYHITIHMFSQVPDIDLKIRNLCDSYYLVENKFRVFSYAKKISKILTVKTDIEGKGNLVDSFQFAPFMPGSTRKLTFIPAWTPFFESFDPPERPAIPYKQMPLSDEHKKAIKNLKLYNLKLLCRNIGIRLLHILKPSEASGEQQTSVDAVGNEVAKIEEKKKKKTMKKWL